MPLRPFVIHGKRYGIDVNRNLEEVDFSLYGRLLRVQDFSDGNNCSYDKKLELEVEPKDVKELLSSPDLTNGRGVTFYG